MQDTTNNTMPHLDNEITKKNTQKKNLMCENHLFKLIKIEKRCTGVIPGQKMI